MDRLASILSRQGENSAIFFQNQGDDKRILARAAPKPKFHSRSTVSPKKVSAHPLERLLDVLRLELRLTGAKEGCGEGECGSCSVLVDGVLVNSCLVPVLQVAGTVWSAIEGLAAGDLAALPCSRLF